MNSAVALGPISKMDAGGLMAKAKKANDLEGFQTGGLHPGTGGFEPIQILLSSTFF